MKPLAYRIRPTKFEDIIGQDHLVGKDGVIFKMAEKKQFYSMILYGKPGCGKTSIASIIASFFPLNGYTFNASVDTKAKLKDIADSKNYYENSLLIIDEIHRMKKDIQDFLLPYIEDGSLIIIGLTTENPYATVNPAIRSRCHVYKLNDIEKDDVIDLLKKTTIDLGYKLLKDEIYDYIAYASSNEIRTALNMLEITFLTENSDITLIEIEKLIGKKSLPLDKEGENYYDILSAMIKSIRGSDPDAGLHYLARLLLIGDLEIITRRLLILAYEDVGLANFNIGPRIMSACDTALKVGMPEARIPLSCAVIDLALSPKSNSGYLAIDAALEDINNMNNFEIPPHILNKELKSGKYTYKYPHDYKDGYIVQDYLPESIASKRYYFPKDISNYEKTLSIRLSEIEEMKKKRKPD